MTIGLLGANIWANAGLLLIAHLADSSIGDVSEIFRNLISTNHIIDNW